MNQKLLNKDQAKRLCILTIDSLHSAAALSQVIPAINDRIKVIYYSDLYRKQKGSFMSQLFKNLKEAGIQYVLYLSFNFVTHELLISLSNLISQSESKSQVHTLKQLAKQYGIPMIKVSNINSQTVLDEIKSLNLDLIVTCMFDQILNNQVFETPKFGSINVHTGLLPRYKGPFPAISAAMANDMKVGGTIHCINSDIDGGAILKTFYLDVQKKYSLLKQDYILMTIAGKKLLSIILNLDTYLASSEKHVGGSYFGYPSRSMLKLVKNNGRKLIKFSDIAFINHYG